nr:unnamed protein product [Callosobruchus analis]
MLVLNKNRLRLKTELVTLVDWNKYCGISVFSEKNSAGYLLSPFRISSLSAKTTFISYFDQHQQSSLKKPTKTFKIRKTIAKNDI